MHIFSALLDQTAKSINFCETLHNKYKRWSLVKLHDFYVYGIVHENFPHHFAVVLWKVWKVFLLLSISSQPSSYTLFLASLYVNCFLGNQQKRYKFHTVIKKKFESDWRFFQKFILMVKTRNQDFKNSKKTCT